MSGTVEDTYAAALQHDRYGGGGTLVGVVRRPTGWFHALVDENVAALGPPEGLLEETKDRQEALKLQGMCDKGAHNAAWEETDFAARYEEHLDADPEARTALDDLVDRLRAGEDVALVCFEGDEKRCHRRILRDRLAERVSERA